MEKDSVKFDLKNDEEIGFGTETVIREIYGQIQDFWRVGKKVEYPKEWTPQFLLPKIHSWLSEGKGLHSEWRNKQMLLMLDPIPIKVLNQILKITFPPSFKSGFWVLQQEAWQRISELQNGGLRVAIIVPDATLPDDRSERDTGDLTPKVNGFYAPGQNLIALEIVGASTVIPHEYRHHEQHLKRLRKGPYTPRVLSPKCLVQADRYFGEVDAISHAFPMWEGAFKNAEIFPEWHLKATKMDRRKATRWHFRQMKNLDYELTYYTTAGQWVTGVLVGETHCPVELNNIVREIGDYTSEVSDTIVFPKPPIKSPRGLWIEHFNLNMALNELENDRLNGLSHEDCEVERQELVREVEELKNSAKTKVEEWNNILSGHISRQKNWISETLEKLSDPIKRDLCWGASGFEHLVNCDRFFALGK